MKAAKAAAAFAVAFAAGLLSEWTGGADAFSFRDLVVAFVIAGTVYLVPNRG